MTVDVRVGDCLDVLRTLDAGSVQTCVTSPPYWGLRDYGHAGQIGLERTPDEYVAKMVAVFAEVRRVLANDGVLWLNLGDCYATGAGAVGDCPGGGEQGARWVGETTRHRDAKRRDHGRPFVNGRGESQNVPTKNTVGPMTQPNRMPIAGLKAKDLIGMPWRVAFALQADGWYLRSDIIWHKPNPMPESVTDRPTKGHEYLFLFAKSERYYYDAPAIAEPCTDERGPGNVNPVRDPGMRDGENANVRGSLHKIGKRETRNRRTVWTVPTTPFAGAHFATFPPALIEPCILAGSRPGDTVLDPFGGAGTTGLVAARHSRSALLIELNPDYAVIARDRIKNDGPLFTDVA